MVRKFDKDSSISFYSLIILALFICCLSFVSGLWKENRIKIDAPSYYTYMPAVFIYGDLHLKFIDSDPQFFKDKIWYYKIENGNRLIKHPIGISLALSPFFLIGHLAAKLNGAPQDGYSLPYQNAVTCGVFIYLFIGLYYLRKMLLSFFTDKIVALTLIAIVLGTNLLWYSTFEGLMPHAISFSFLSVCLYSFYKWLRDHRAKHLYIFATFLGLSILIRPLAITLILYFLIIAILSKGSFKNFVIFINPYFKQIVVAIIISICILFLQLAYWKYATGSWVYDVYIDEHFVFSSPQIFAFLFSFRKGVFIYTPILLFAVTGLVYMFRSNRPVFYGTLIIMIFTVFILSSWWAWSYGICWGMRPMIDYYSILSIPLGAGFSYINSKGKLLSVLQYGIVSLFIILNLFQTWQYKNGLIHYDDMTREAYFKGFFQTKATPDWKDLLKPYNWNRRIKGLPQVEYSKEYFDSNYNKYSASLRGCNQEYVAINPKAQNAVASYLKEISANAEFNIQSIKGDTICIRSSNGKYLSIHHEYDNVILANSITPGLNEFFVIVYLSKNDNKIALRSFNGKFIHIDKNFPYMLFANAETITSDETFRLFLNEN